MKLKTIRKKECIGRVSVFGERDDIVFTAEETALFTSLAPVKVALTNATTLADAGKRAFRETSDERAAAAIMTRGMMRDIAEIAKALSERGVDVGAREAFRMPRYGTYASLAQAANAFVELVEPRKALFIARGLAATFVEDLSALIVVLNSAGDNAGSERSRGVGGTTAFEAEANRGMAIVRELRAIMRVKFRANPGLLAEWKSLARVHSTGGGAEGEATVPPPSGGAGTGGGSGS
jgi:hypothetical protein